MAPLSYSSAALRTSNIKRASQRPNADIAMDANAEIVVRYVHV